MLYILYIYVSAESQFDVPWLNVAAILHIGFIRVYHILYNDLFCG